MAALAYVFTFAYMIFLVVVGEIVQKKTKVNSETIRKVEHIAASINWVFAYLLAGPTYHLIIINLLGFIALSILTFGNFAKYIQRDDTDKSYGVFYFGLSTLIVITIAVVLGEPFVMYSGIAYFCLALADGLAPLVSKLFGKANFKVYEPKSFVGFLTVFIISTIVTLVFNEIFSLNLSILFAFSLGSVAAHAELYGRRGIDNLLVNLLTFIYLLLNHYGLVTIEFQIASLLVMLITPFSAGTKALTFYGGLMAAIYLALSSFFGNIALIVMIFGLFFVEAIISKITTRIFNERMGREKEKHSRGLYQIIANGFAPLVCTSFFYFTSNYVFLFGAIVALAEEFSDSVASDVGRLSGKPPRDILTLKHIETGISGGVSGLGLISACIAAFTAVAIGYAFGVMDLWKYLILSALAFGGTIIDSILGSSIQVLYKCPVCNLFTERKTHCDSTAVKVKGISIIDNTTVNLMSGIIIAIITIALSFII